MIMFSLNDNPRAIHAFKYVSAIAISNGGSIIIIGYFA